MEGQVRGWLVEARGNRLQKDVAESAGVAPSAYCAYELGTRRPSVDTAKKLGELLGFPWTRFFDEQGTD